VIKDRRLRRDAKKWLGGRVGGVAGWVVNYVTPRPRFYVRMGRNGLFAGFHFYIQNPLGWVGF
jgi:hypothetical protein